MSRGPWYEGAATHKLRSTGLRDAKRESAMIERKQFYIDGAWVDPVTPLDHHVINPATEEAIAVISLGGEADAVKAILAARAAFPAFSETSHDERI
eukprot:gene22955-43372_t